MHYKYCPTCGSKLTLKEAGDDGGVPYCEHCAKYWFDGFSTCVIILVANELQEIAMLRQNYLSTQYYSYVSGFIQPGENAESTAMREVKEELGIDLDSLDFAGTYYFPKRDQLMIGFIGLCRKQPLRLSSEVNNAKWIPANEAESLMFPDSPGNAMHPIFRKYLGMIIKKTTDSRM